LLTHTKNVAKKQKFAKVITKKTTFIQFKKMTIVVDKTW